MKKDRTLLLIMALVFIAGAVFADPVNPVDMDSLFDNANALYKDGKYKEAIGEYRKILDRDHVSGNLFYNIGNCYFKLGMLGKAILYYERAKRLIPKDGDLGSNFEFAMSLKESGPEQRPVNWFLGVMYRIYSGVNVNGLTLFLFCCYIITIAVLMAGIFNSRFKRLSIWILAVMIIILVSGITALTERISGIDADSIITQETAEVKFAPFDDATTFFQVFEGDKVRVIHSTGQWSKIRRPDGKIGWMKSDGLEVI